MAIAFELIFKVTNFQLYGQNNHLSKVLSFAKT